MPNGYDPNAATADQRRPLAPPNTRHLHRAIRAISGTDVAVANRRNGSSFLFGKRMTSTIPPLVNERSR